MAVASTESKFITIREFISYFEREISMPTARNRAARGQLDSLNLGVISSGFAAQILALACRPARTEHAFLFALKKITARLSGLASCTGCDFSLQEGSVS